LPKVDSIALDSLKAPQPLIFINDILEIRIGGENSKTVQYINSYLGGGTNGTAMAVLYTVDVDGNIELPKIGKVKVENLTRDEARDTITNLYKQFLIDPIVSIKFSNFRFSVIGEVKIPGAFSIASERVNIFEALAQAGDITSFGRFTNVHIIRDVNGKRKIITVNLTDKNILNSSNYYINRYDVIYVESRPLKTITDNFTRTTTFIATIASFLALILVIKK
jgi:polysaccharide export outer membrane protein